MALVRQGDHSMPDSARESQIAESRLRRWVKQDQLDRRDRDVRLGARRPGRLQREH